MGITSRRFDVNTQERANRLEAFEYPQVRPTLRVVGSATMPAWSPVNSARPLRVSVIPAAATKIAVRRGALPS